MNPDSPAEPSREELIALIAAQAATPAGRLPHLLPKADISEPIIASGSVDDVGKPCQRAGKRMRCNSEVDLANTAPLNIAEQK
jgi:hypothetical protein